MPLPETFPSAGVAFSLKAYTCLQACPVPQATTATPAPGELTPNMTRPGLPSCRQTRFCQAQGSEVSAPPEEDCDVAASFFPCSWALLGIPGEGGIPEVLSCVLIMCPLALLTFPVVGLSTGQVEGTPDTNAPSPVTS